MTWEQFRDLLPVLTLILGGVIALGTERLRSRWDRGERRRQARSQFELTTLIELQSHLAELCQAAQDCMEERPRYGDPSAEVHGRYFRANLTSAALSARLGSAFRDEVQELLTSARHIAVGPDDDETMGEDPDDLLDAFLVVYQNVEEAVGDRIREIHGL